MPRGRSADPESERHAWLAIAALRVELLYAAIGYGIYSALSEGGAASAREWRSLLDWVARLVSGAGRRVRENIEQPAWLTQVVELIDAFDQSAAEGHGDLFMDELARNWARTEFERLAERARPIERMAGEPLGEIEDRKSGAGMALFGAIQDSLVLAVSDDEGARAMRASSIEIYEELRAAREEGVWDALAGS